MEQGVPPSMSTTVGPHVGHASNENVCTGGSRAESLDNCDSQKVSGGDEVEVGVVEDVLVLHPIADHAKEISLGGTTGTDDECSARKRSAAAVQSPALKNVSTEARMGKI